MVGRCCETGIDKFQGRSVSPREVNSCLAASGVNKSWDAFFRYDFKAFLTTFFDQRFRLGVGVRISRGVPQFLMEIGIHKYKCRCFAIVEQVQPSFKIRQSFKIFWWIIEVYDSDFFNFLCV
jgi:hypothetical protein